MISLFGSHVGKEELQAVGDCFERQWLGVGPKSAEFEASMAKKVGAPSFVFLNSGSNALHLALRLLNIPKGKEVILPSFTWIACANAVMLNELKPVFCDVDLLTCNMRAEDVEKKITKNTAAIMVVHYAGKPVDMDSLKRFNLPILEDAAHAIDSFYKGRHCGTIGDVGIYSFDAVKNMTTGEGGGLVAKSSEAIDHARKLRYCGIGKSGFQASATNDRWWEYKIYDSFPKMLNTDIAAAIGCVQLAKLPSFQARRKELWRNFRATLSETWASDWLTLPAEPEAHEQHSYFTYCVQLREGSRDKLAKYLYDNGVYSSLRFHPLHMNPIYKSEGRLENCERLNEIALNLPFHHRLSDENCDQIFTALKDFRKSM